MTMQLVRDLVGDLSRAIDDLADWQEMRPEDTTGPERERLEDYQETLKFARAQLAAQAVAATDDAALALVRRVWQSCWVYDDYSEVCITIEARNEIGEFLVARGEVAAADFEPLPVEGNEGDD